MADLTKAVADTFEALPARPTLQDRLKKKAEEARKPTEKKGSDDGK